VFVGEQSIWFVESCSIFPSPSLPSQTTEELKNQYQDLICPFLLLHGDADLYCDAQMVKNLYERSKSLVSGLEGEVWHMKKRWCHPTHFPFNDHLVLLTRIRL